MASGTPSVQVRIPVGDLISPPHSTSAHTILLGEKLSGGVKIMLRRNNYPGRARVGQKIEKKILQCRKLSHTAENTLFHILIHCETIPYPYSLPKTLSLYIAENIPYLNTLPKLYPILIHCRNYTLS